MTAPIIELRHVGKDFTSSGGLFRSRDVVRAVGDVSLSVGPGETLGLVGESGSGKTTLGRMMLGLLAPSRGQVLLNGAPLGTDRRAIASQLQMVFQDPYSSLNPRWRIADAVGLPLAVHGVGRGGERRDRVSEMLGRVGLSPAMGSRHPAQLSGGQRQRAVIARALILRPRLVVLDEPTSALDVSVQAQILNLLLDLQDQLNLAYVLITHNLAVVHHMAHRIAVMFRGVIVETGRAETMLTSPEQAYTRTLVSSMLDRGQPFPAS